MPPKLKCYTRKRKDDTKYVTCNDNKKKLLPPPQPLQPAGAGAFPNLNQLTSKPKKKTKQKSPQKNLTQVVILSNHHTAKEGFLRRFPRK